ncbi:MAG TPA: NfeD family protein [Rhodanobacteraceae bacterium]|jgi:membrane protein implicated in regulation of membrane protease activity|nr:NfeD family protein [Rhodanobacteraceae bacterium]
MENLLNNYGWWLLALVLIATEIVMPGYFMLWIGIAAGIMGIVTFVAPSLSPLVQTIVFALLAVASCAIYWRFLRPLAEHRDDQPLLNRRGQRMVGRRVVVVEPIVNGRGKVKVGDGSWLAEGPDVAAGTEVEVVAVDGTTLKVRAVAA